MIIFGYIADNE